MLENNSSANVRKMHVGGVRRPNEGEPLFMGFYVISLEGIHAISLLLCTCTRLYVTRERERKCDVFLENALAAMAHSTRHISISKTQDAAQLSAVHMCDSAHCGRDESDLICMARAT